jgi:hypothetical protein
MPIIPALQRKWQKDGDFEATLGYMYQSNNNNKNTH